MEARAAHIITRYIVEQEVKQKMEPETMVILLVVGYIITTVYSIYMAVLNWKQAKVKDILLETNRILERIEKKMK